MTNGKNETMARRLACGPALFLPAGICMAASTSNTITSLFEEILSALNSASTVVVTIAIVWCGYKVLFGGRTLMEVAPVLIGGILIGAASTIVKYFNLAG